MKETPPLDWSNLLRVDHRSAAPVYSQIMEGIKELVYRGRLGEGERLPPVRALAEALDINPNTVARAYHELESQGILSSRVGRGTFLAPMNRQDKKEAKQNKLDSLWQELRERSLEMGLTGDDLAEHLKEKLAEQGGKK